MRYEPKRTATIVVGGWFGDEGKGKIISYLAARVVVVWIANGRGSVAVSLSVEVAVHGRALVCANQSVDDGAVDCGTVDCAVEDEGLGGPVVAATEVACSEDEDTGEGVV